MFPPVFFSHNRACRFKNRHLSVYRRFIRYYKSYSTGYSPGDTFSINQSGAIVYYKITAVN